MGLVYKITNSITNQIYVGKTEQTLEQRFSQHVAKAKLNKSYLHRSMNKYGVENFRIELLEEVDDAVLNDREIFWIAHLNSFAPNGLNLTLGGDGGDTSHHQTIKRQDNAWTLVARIIPTSGNVG